ncbi:phage tail tube protein [Acetobacter sp. KSO5]|uniref:phage tail tube protein n=1 Tax=Acetobacter sp. KSO5 TaxID=3373674 RepID=UPI00376EC948
MAYTGATTGFAAGAETNDSAVDYALETIYNQPPTGAYQALRYTGFSLAVNETETQPDEINDTPEMAQSVLIGRTAQGDTSGILSAITYDDFLSGVMTADWSVISQAATSSVTISIASRDQFQAGNDTISAKDSTGIVDVFSEIVSGDIVSISDPSVGISASYAVTKISGGVIYFSPGTFDGILDKIATLSGEAGGTSGNLGTGAIVSCTFLKNGKIGKSFTFRKKLNSKLEMYSGTMVNQAQITLQKGQPATISFDLVGSDLIVSDTDIASSVTPRTTTPLIDTVTGFLGCSIFGTTPSGCIQSATITLSRDGSGQDTGMGHVGACGIRFGSFKAAMEITYLFRDYQQFTDWKNGKTGPVTVGVQGSDGIGYQFNVLNGIIRNPKTPISGKNQTVVATVSITANPISGGGTFAIYKTKN